MVPEIARRERKGNECGLHKFTFLGCQESHFLPRERARLSEGGAERVRVRGRNKVRRGTRSKVAQRNKS